MDNLQLSHSLRQRYFSNVNDRSPEFRAYLTQRNMKMIGLLSVLIGALGICAIVALLAISRAANKTLSSSVAFFAVFLAIVLLLFIMARMLERRYPCNFRLQYWYGNLFSLFLLLPMASYIVWLNDDSALQPYENIPVFYYSF